jgi:hypothetical protein
MTNLIPTDISDRAGAQMFSIVFATLASGEALPWCPWPT